MPPRQIVSSGYDAANRSDCGRNYLRTGSLDPDTNDEPSAAACVRPHAPGPMYKSPSDYAFSSTSSRPGGVSYAKRSSSQILALIGSKGKAARSSAVEDGVAETVTPADRIAATVAASSSLTGKDRTPDVSVSADRGRSSPPGVPHGGDDGTGLVGTRCAGDNDDDDEKTYTDPTGSCEEADTALKVPDECPTPSVCGLAEDVSTRLESVGVRGYDGGGGGGGGGSVGSGVPASTARSAAAARPDGEICFQISFSPFSSSADGSDDGGRGGGGDRGCDGGCDVGPDGDCNRGCDGGHDEGLHGGRDGGCDRSHDEGLHGGRDGSHGEGLHGGLHGGRDRSCDRSHDKGLHGGRDRSRNGKHDNSHVSGDRSPSCTPCSNTTQFTADNIAFEDHRRTTRLDVSRFEDGHHAAHPELSASAGGGACTAVGHGSAAPSWTSTLCGGQNNTSPKAGNHLRPFSAINHRRYTFKSSTQRSHALRGATRSEVGTREDGTCREHRVDLKSFDSGTCPVLLTGAQGSSQSVASDHRCDGGVRSPFASDNCRRDRLESSGCLVTSQCSDGPPDADPLTDKLMVTEDECSVKQTLLATDRSRDQQKEVRIDTKESAQTLLDEQKISRFNGVESEQLHNRTSVTGEDVFGNADGVDSLQSAGEAVVKRFDENTMESCDMHLLEPAREETLEGPDNVSEGLDEKVLEGLHENVLEGLEEKVLEGLEEKVLEGLEEKVFEGLEEKVLEGLEEEVLEGLDEKVLQFVNTDMLTIGEEEKFTDNETIMSVDDVALDYNNENMVESTEENVDFMDKERDIYNDVLERTDEETASLIEANVNFSHKEMVTFSDEKPESEDVVGTMHGEMVGSVGEDMLVDEGSLEFATLPCCGENLTELWSRPVQLDGEERTLDAATVPSLPCASTGSQASCESQWSSVDTMAMSSESSESGVAGCDGGRHNTLVPEQLHHSPRLDAIGVAGCDGGRHHTLIPGPLHHSPRLDAVGVAGCDGGRHNTLIPGPLHHSPRLDAVGVAGCDGGRHNTLVPEQLHHSPRLDAVEVAGCDGGRHNTLVPGPLHHSPRLDAIGVAGCDGGRHHTLVPGPLHHSPRLDAVGVAGCDGGRHNTLVPGPLHHSPRLYNARVAGSDEGRHNVLVHGRSSAHTTYIPEWNDTSHEKQETFPACIADKYSQQKGTVVIIHGTQADRMEIL